MGSPHVSQRRFACRAGIGFDANVVREVTPRLKRYLRSLAFPLVALKVYFKVVPPDLHIIDGDTTHVAQFAVVANGHYYGGSSRWLRTPRSRAARWRWSLSRRWAS